MDLLNEIVQVTLRNHAGRMTAWEANMLARALIAECRRREEACRNALPGWKKAWRRLIGRGFR